MPLFDFQCLSCHKIFEEIAKNTEAAPPCPFCHFATSKALNSAPAPLKTNAFPYKIGKPRPKIPKLSGCSSKNGIS